MTREAVEEPGTLTLLDLAVDEVEVDTMTGPVSAGFDVWASREREEGELERRRKNG